MGLLDAPHAVGTLTRQLRDAGKGWSNSGGFGFTRDDYGFITVDAREWGVVLLVHEMYDSCGSIPSCARSSRGRHQTLTGRLHKILRDERFLAGRIATKEATACDGTPWRSTTPCHSICGITTRGS